MYQQPQGGYGGYPQQQYGAPGGYPAPGMGAPGMGAPGMGAPGMGAPGMGMQPGYGAPAPGGYPPQQGAPGMGVPGGYGAPGSYPPPGMGAPGAPGGYGAPPMSGMPGAMGPPMGGMPAAPGQWWSGFLSMVAPTEMQRLQMWFISVDRDRSGTINSSELAKVVFFDRRLTQSICERLMRLFDKDKNGILDFNEFVSLHAMVMQLTTAFMASDTNHSGNLEMGEIVRALATIGINATPAIVQRFCRAWYPGSKIPRVSYDHFILLGAQLQYLKLNFMAMQQAGRISFDLDSLVTFVLDLV